MKSIQICAITPHGVFKAKKVDFPTEEVVDKIYGFMEKINDLAYIKLDTGHGNIYYMSKEMIGSSVFNIIIEQ